METVDTDAPERNNHEIFRESITELNGIIRSSFRTTIAQIAAVLAAIATPLFMGDLAAKRHLGIAFIVAGVFLLLLVLQFYDLARHGRAKQVHDHLAKQLKIAVMQRIRADKLYDLSILDPLTGLHNRRFGEQRLEEEVARSERNGEPLAVLLFDLDYFKEINDQFGHAAGDAALKEFARRLKRAIRACDVPVRIGGDEFLVILPECPTEKVNMIVDRIGAPEIQFNRRGITVRYSVGRAHYQVCDTSQTMLQRADEVLYAEKATRHSHDAAGDDRTHLGTHQKVGDERPPSIRT
jgi:diguanylate cyclase (GGDEF)-like protein